jgi:hypothetical protein
VKTLPILLALSLLGNAVLAGAYLMWAGAAAPLPTAHTPTAPGTSGEPAPAQALESGSTAAQGPAKSAFSWAEIETDDLDELARRLKSAGFTSREIRRILAQRISRMTMGTNAKEPVPYWRAARTNYEDPKIAEDFRKRMAEQSRLYRKYLMGPDAIADDPDRLEIAKHEWGDLPLEKLQAIAAIEADYQEMSMQQYLEQRSRPGETAPRDAARLMEQERMADIAKILTPEEFAEFELRSSPTAALLRHQLSTFQPTEDEYRTLFTIHKAYADQLRDSRLTPDARKALTAEITNRVKTVLGEDRALDYDAAVNQNSRDQTASLVSRLGLPARVATEVRQAQQDFTQRAKDIRASTGLSLEERNVQLAALARQAESQLTAKLGANGYEAYTDLKGEWIRALQPTSGP